MFHKYSKNSFSNLVTGNETWENYFQRKRKSCNRVWATKDATRPSIPKRQRTIKTVLYVVFFDNKGPVMQSPVPKDRTVTGAFYKNVLKKLKAHLKRRRPKTGLKYSCLLHDNAPADKARIVTEFLVSEKVNVPTHRRFLPDLAPCDYLLFPKLRFHLSGKRYKSKNAHGSAVYQFLMGVPVQDYERCFQNSIDRLKKLHTYKWTVFLRTKKSRMITLRILKNNEGT